MKLPRLPSLHPRERLLAVGAGAVLLIVALDRSVIAPWLKHGQHVRQETLRMESALRSHERLLARKDHVLVERSRYQRYLKPPVADDLQVATLLKELEVLVSQSGLILNEIKPLPTDISDTARRYALEIRFQCTLEQWVNFVYRIETSSALYEIVRAGLLTKEELPDRLEGFLQVVTTVPVPESASVPVQLRISMK